MPSETDDAVSTRNWGKVDRAALRKLVLDGNVDIKDLSYENIDAIQEQCFPHRTVRNFWRNFKDYSGAFNLERELINTRCAAEAPAGKMCYYIIVNACRV
jgi:hypothetical protein